jgi:DHA1 family tetracycline resistance protein-like MFS transporter
VNDQQKKKGKPLLAVFSTIFIDMLGVGILIPVFPLLVLPHSPYRITPTGWSVADGFILLGWLSACYPLAQFFAAPILGQLSDRYGRKIILTISIIGTSFAYVLFAIGITTKNIPLMFISRIVDGLTGGNISVAQAVISDISTPKNRARNFGLVGAAFGLGFIFGPYIGGKLADPSVVSWFNASTAFWFAAILSAVNAVVVIGFLPETIKKKTTEFKLHALEAFTNIAKAFTNSGLRNITPSTFLFNAGFTFFTTFFAVFLAVRFGFSQGNTGDYFAYFGIWIAIVQGGLIGIVSKRFKDYQVLRYSFFGGALTLLTYLLIPNGHHRWLFLIPPVLALFIGMSQAFLPTIVSRVTPKEIQGESLGINTSVSAMAQAIPAIIAGYVATINTSATVITASILIALAGIIFWVLFKPKKYISNT